MTETEKEKMKKTKKFLSLYFSGGQFGVSSERYTWDVKDLPNGYAMVHVVSNDGKQTIRLRGIMVIKETEVE